MKKFFFGLMFLASGIVFCANGSSSKKVPPRVAPKPILQECPICLEDKGALQMWTLPKRDGRCGHAICKSCIAPSTENMRCPMCREFLSEEDLPQKIEVPVNIDELVGPYSFHEGFLDLYEKELETVRGLNDYSRASEVQSLVLNSNPIQNLPAGAFEAYENLEKLHIDFVPLRRINQDAFKGLNKLKELSFSGLELERQNHPLVITSQTLESFAGSLKKLILIDNGLTTLPDWVYFLNHLSELNLDDNELNLTEDMFKPFSQLQVLDLDGNRLTDLPEKIFEGLNLRKVSLAENRFTKIPAALNVLNDLRDLDLSENELILEKNNFQDFTELENLDLSYNSLNSIPEGMLDNCFILQHLDLSFNGLESLPVGLLSNLPRLKSLNLLGNNFSLEEQMRIKQEITNPHCMVFFTPKEKAIGVTGLKLIEGDVDAGTDVWVDQYGLRWTVDDEGVAVLLD